MANLNELKETWMADTSYFAVNVSGEIGYLEGFSQNKLLLDCKSKVLLTAQESLRQLWRVEKRIDCNQLGRKDRIALSGKWLCGELDTAFFCDECVAFGEHHVQLTHQCLSSDSIRQIWAVKRCDIAEYCTPDITVEPTDARTQFLFDHLPKTVLNKLEYAVIWCDELLLHQVISNSESLDRYTPQESETILQRFQQPRSLQKYGINMDAFSVAQRLSLALPESTKLILWYLYDALLTQELTQRQIVGILNRVCTLLNKDSDLEELKQLLEYYPEEVGLSIHAQAHYCRALIGLGLWPKVTIWLKHHPDLLTGSIVPPALRGAQVDDSQPSAFWRSIGAAPHEPDAFESVLVAGDLDGLYEFISDPEKMDLICPPFSEEERQNILNRLPGIAECESIPERVLMLQGNRNHFAEQLLWQDIEQPWASHLLLKLYCEEDRESFLWIAEHRPNLIYDHLDGIVLFLKLLSANGESKKVEEIVAAKPELLFQPDVFRVFYDNCMDTHRALIEEIAATNRDCPIPPKNPFEQALVAGDQHAMLRCLKEQQLMEGWGYSSELQQRLKERLEGDATPYGTDPKATATRFAALQGNLHRQFEAFLHTCQQADDSWLHKRLFGVLCQDRRWNEAFAYIRAYPDILDNKFNTPNYLWCLYHLQKYDQFLAEAKSNPKLLSKNSDLLKAVSSVAVITGNEEYTHYLQESIALEPKNSFERALFSGDYTQVQHIISDPKLLIGMGYSQGEIETLTDRLPKYTGGYASTEGFEQASRIHFFLGGERAEPFLWQCLEDPRSVKELFHILQKGKRWDELCALFREHRDVLNNAHYNNIYNSALVHASDIESCEELVSRIRQKQKTDQPLNVADLWNYACALVRLSRTAELDNLDTMLMDRSRALPPAEHIARYIDALWNFQSERAVLFSARMMEHRWKSLRKEQINLFFTVNDRLTMEDWLTGWAELLEEHNLNGALDLCCLLGDSSTDERRLRSERCLTSCINTLQCFDPQKDSAPDLLWTIEMRDLMKASEQQLQQLDWELVHAWVRFFDANDDAQKLQYQPQMEHLIQLVSHDAELMGELVYTWERPLRTVQPESDSDYLSIYSCLLDGEALPEDEKRELLDQLIDAWGVVLSEKHLTRPQQTALSDLIKNHCQNEAQLHRILEIAREKNITSNLPLCIDYLSKAVDLQPNDALDWIMHALAQEDTPEGGNKTFWNFYLLVFRKVGDALELNNERVDLLLKICLETRRIDDLKLLYRICRRSAKDELADELLMITRQSAVQEEDTLLDTPEAYARVPYVRDWFVQKLNSGAHGQLREHCRLLSPIVETGGEDSLRTSLAYLGVEDQVNEETREAVARLLYSNIDDKECLQCFERIFWDQLTPVGRAGFACISASLDFSSADVAVASCLQADLYLDAINLIQEMMTNKHANSAFIGKMLGKIYTEQSIAQHTELLGVLPKVFLRIKILNKSDPIGEWKNLSRAADIAVLTHRETVFFQCLSPDVFYKCPGKCAVVIASLILHGEYNTASRLLREDVSCVNTNEHLELLSQRLPVIQERGCLSDLDEFLLRSIPRDGNKRSIKAFGALADQAFYNGQVVLLRDALGYIWGTGNSASDKVLSCSALSTYLADSNGDLQLLYRIIKSYLASVPENHFRQRAMRALIVVDSCLRAVGRRMEQSVDDVCMELGQGEISPMEIRRIQTLCDDYFVNHGLSHMNILLYAATGWWRLSSAAEIDVLYEEQISPALFAELLKIFPVSFYAGIMCYELRNAGNSLELAKVRQVLETVRSLMPNKKVDAVQNVIEGFPREYAPSLEKLLDQPTEYPGLFALQVPRVLAEIPKKCVVQALKILFACQPNFGIPQYQADQLEIRSNLNASSPDKSHLVALALSELQAECEPESIGKDPRQYINIKNYSFGLISAEKMPVDNRKIKIERRACTINLCRFLSQQMSAQDAAKLRLLEIVNMSNILLNSPSYDDIDKILELCKKPHWKITVRCLQEIMQGNPRSVLDVLNDYRFAKHAGCAAIVKKLMSIACSVNANSVCNKLKEESIKIGRDSMWGIFTERELPPAIGDMTGFIMPPLRNPASIHALAEDVAPWLEESEKQLQVKQQQADLHRSSVENTDQEEAIRHCRELHYVTEQLSRLEDGFNHTEDSDGELTVNAERLAQQLKTSMHRDERIDILTRLLYSTQNRASGEAECEYVLRLGLDLFSTMCAGSVYGLNQANPEARTVLYEMGKCVPGVTNVSYYSENIRNALLLCFESYDALPDLVSDCGRAEIAILCSVITDIEARAAIQSFVDHVRKVGRIMGASAPSEEKVRGLKGLVSEIKKNKTFINEGIMQNLIIKINQQIQTLSGFAQVSLTVYTTTGARYENVDTGEDNVRIFGKVENTGLDPVSNLSIELFVDDLGVTSQKLNHLYGRSTVPFEFEVKIWDDCDHFDFSIIGQFFDKDGRLCQIKEVRKQFVVAPSQSYELHAYSSDVPADEENYCERQAILTDLKSYYPQGRSFSAYPNLSIYGMRRTGKSSILRRLRRLLEEQCGDKICAVITSAEGLHADHDPFLLRTVLVKGVLADLETKYGDCFQGEAWKAFKDRWTQAEITYEAAEGLYDFYHSLRLEWLGERNIVVMVDEMEALFSITNSQMRLDNAILSPLHSVMTRLAQTENTVKFVFCGSDYFINCMTDGDHLTQLFQRRSVLRVGRMTYTEIEQALLKTGKANELKYHDDSIHYLCDSIGGLPWHSKILVNDIIMSRLNRQSRNIVYPSDISWGADRLLNNNMACSEDSMGNIALTADESIIRRLMANALETPGSGILRSELRALFLEEVDEDANAEERFSKAIGMLVTDRQLISESGSKEDPLYSFGCELYRLYNRKQKPEAFYIED